MWREVAEGELPTLGCANAPKFPFNKNFTDEYQ
jgi:hypothetical protein